MDFKSVPALKGRLEGMLPPDLFDDFFSYGEITPLTDVINKLSNELFNNSIRVDNYNYPKINIIEYIDKFTIEATVTGIPKKDLEVGIKTDGEGTKYLVIKHDKKTETHKSGVYKTREIKQSRFMRKLRLSENLDVEGIKSECKYGLLSVTVPKVTIDNTPTESYEEVEIK